MCAINNQAVKRRVSLVEPDLSTLPKKLPTLPVCADLFVQLYVLPLSIPCWNVDQELFRGTCVHPRFIIKGVVLLFNHHFLCSVLSILGLFYSVGMF